MMPQQLQRALRSLATPSAASWSMHSPPSGIQRPIRWCSNAITQRHQPTRAWAIAVSRSFIVPHRSLMTTPPRHQNHMNSTSTSTSTSVSESTNSGEACSGTLPRPHLAPLPFIYLRNLPYLRSLDLQQLLVDRQIRLRQQQEQRQEGSDAPKSSEDLLLLVEHPPTYTNGRRNRGVKGLGEEEVIRLQKLGANYVETLRGGEITFHGPGQLVAYPILDIKASQLSVRCYVSFLEKAIIATCAEWGLKAMTTENTGVWINDQQKIAAIGVHVQRYITSHGLALNCNTDLNFFRQIIACGLTGKETTSLSREQSDPLLNVERAIPSFLRGFGKVFSRETIPLSDKDPELERRILRFVESGDASLLQ